LSEIKFLVISITTARHCAAFIIVRSHSSGHSASMAQHAHAWRLAPPDSDIEALLDGLEELV
jgi:hypothetical protein